MFLGTRTLGSLDLLLRTRWTKARGTQPVVNIVPASFSRLSGVCVCVCVVPILFFPLQSGQIQFSSTSGLLV